MKITRAAEYAVRCILYLSKRGTGQLVTKVEISDNANIPSNFLAKIAQDLSKAHLIEIKQGPKGGYILIEDPFKITLLQVIEIMIGEIHLNDCTFNPDGCKASTDCSVNRIWITARTQLRKTLQAANFAELAKEKSCLQELDINCF